MLIYFGGLSATKYPTRVCSPQLIFNGLNPTNCPQDPALRNASSTVPLPRTIRARTTHTSSHQATTPQNSPTLKPKKPENVRFPYPYPAADESLWAGTVYHICKASAQRDWPPLCVENFLACDRDALNGRRTVVMYHGCLGLNSGCIWRVFDGRRMLMSGRK